MDRARVARHGLVAIAAAGIAASLLAAPNANATTNPKTAGQESSAQQAPAQQTPTQRAAAADVARAVSAEGAAELDWKPCPEGTASGALAQFLECTTVPVPVDYSQPDGKKIDIAISRLPSQNPKKKRGVLLTNPGGPGGPGLSIPVDIAELGAPASLLDSYDIIGMDPRGIGKSAPVGCGFTEEQGYLSNIPPYANDDADVEKYAKVAKGVAEQCLNADEDGTLRHISTANTARDMDVIREALGEEKINYFGLSYGTVLGSAYSSLFPERTDRVVLDSNVGDSALDSEGFRRFGLGAEQRFPDFAKYVAERYGTYRIGRTPAEVRHKFFQLADRLDRKPVEGFDGKAFRMNVFGGLYDDGSFPTTAQLWQSLENADGEAARKLAKKLNPRGVPTDDKSSVGAQADEPSPLDNQLAAQLAVVCNDSEFPREVAAYQHQTRVDRARFPVFGGAASNILPCAYWPKPLEPKVPITDNGPSNVLLMQNLRDPATPHVGGVMLRKKFGDRARLVSVDQGGHGAYLFNDNPCGLNITTTYLVDGKFPSSDRLCSASQDSGLQLSKKENQQRKAALKRLRAY